MTRLPATSVVICTLDRPGLLLAAIRSLLDGAQVPDEIVVVDQSASPPPLPLDEGAEQGCTITHLRHGGRGLSAGRNAGAAAAAGPVLAFVDDDIVASRDWLAALVRALADGGGRRVCTGRVLPVARTGGGGFHIGLRPDERQVILTEPGARDLLAGGNMALFRETLLAVGGFDERLGAGATFPAAEDNDLGFRLLRAGFAIEYVPAALVHHHSWRPTSLYLRVRWRYGVGQGGFYSKHLRRDDLHTLGRAGAQVRHYLLRLPWRLVRNPRRAAGDAVFTAGLISGMLRWRLGARRSASLSSDGGHVDDERG